MTTENVNDSAGGVGLQRMVRSLPAAPLEIQRLINALPPDVNKKLSLHDLKRIADAYNTGPCPNCYSAAQMISSQNAEPIRSDD